VIPVGRLEAAGAFEQATAGNSVDPIGRRRRQRLVSIVVAPLSGITSTVAATGPNRHVRPCVRGIRSTHGQR